MQRVYRFVSKSQLERHATRFLAGTKIFRYFQWHERKSTYKRSTVSSLKMSVAYLFIERAYSGKHGHALACTFSPRVHSVHPFASMRKHQKHIYAGMLIIHENAHPRILDRSRENAKEKKNYTQHGQCRILIAPSYDSSRSGSRHVYQRSDDFHIEGFIVVPYTWYLATRLLPWNEMHLVWDSVYDMCACTYRFSDYFSESASAYGYRLEIISLLPWLVIKLAR